ncbi:hypothetical protein Slin15195_G111810 [Septoria linicola]|uniref:Uncharacterized protein n=1 Tax=Septoria linicola TaxID=215465 RepID=A0A9Q9AXN4_9PEZI|nr:hypothetical protein Slin15195_G111810 [Septoria linicola]
MSYFNQTSTAVPFIDAAHPYRPIATPPPITNQQEVGELLARGRELIDNQLWLASEWLSTTELLSHQQAATDSDAITGEDITESIRRALVKCARQSGRSAKADIAAFEYASYERRVANLEQRATTETTIDFASDLTSLREAILDHESRNNKGKKVAFAPLQTSTNTQAAPAPSIPASTHRKGAGAGPKPNPDVRYLNQWPNSAELHDARSARFASHASRVSFFEHRTTLSRSWHDFSVSRANIRGGERARLGKRIPELEAELALAKKAMADMEASEMEEEVKYGEKMRQGKVDARRLEGYRKFLGMESNVEPDLDEDGYVLKGQEGNGDEDVVGSGKGKQKVVAGFEVEDDDDEMEVT